MSPLNRAVFRVIIGNKLDREDSSTKLDTEAMFSHIHSLDIYIVIDIMRKEVVLCF